jgi:hypothetical protein
MNEEAKQQLHQHSEVLDESVRQELAAMLKMDGTVIGKLTGSAFGNLGGHKRRPRRRNRILVVQPNAPLPEFISQDPPTALEFAYDCYLKLAPGQKMWLTLTTNAANKYNDCIEIYATDPMKQASRSQLEDGIFQVQVEIPEDAAIGSLGTLVVELRSLPNGPRFATLAVTKSYKVAEPRKRGSKPLTMPEIEYVFLNQTSPQWSNPLDWPKDPAKVAFEMWNEDGSRTVYINETFPTYHEIFNRLSSNSPQIADRFRTRYKLYLSAWSLKTERLAEELENPQMKPEPEYQRGLNVQFADICSYSAAKEVEQEVELFKAAS